VSNPAAFSIVACLLPGQAATLDTIRAAEIAMIYQDPTTALNRRWAVGAQISEVLRQHLGMDGEGAASVRASCCSCPARRPRRISASITHQLSGACEKGDDRHGACLQPDVS